MSPAAVDPQAWGEWAIHVEELIGLRIHGDVLELALEAWERGDSAQAFAERWHAEELGAESQIDTRAQPFSAPDDPSSPLLACAAGVLATLLILLVGTLLGFALAPFLLGLFP